MSAEVQRDPELTGIESQIVACEKMLDGLRGFEDSLCRDDAQGSLDYATLALCRSSLWQAAATLTAELCRLRARKWELDQLQAVVADFRDQLASGSGGGVMSMLGGLLGFGGSKERPRPEASPDKAEGA